MLEMGLLILEMAWVLKVDTVGSPDEIESSLDCWWDRWGLWDVAALGVVPVLVGHVGEADQLALWRRPTDFAGDLAGLITSA